MSDNGKPRQLALLFGEMFAIALFVVGGGLAILAVADDVFSRRRKWTKEGELLEQLPLFQMVPGLIAAHTAVYVGRKVAGPLGSTVALAAIALPSLIIFLTVSCCYADLPLDSPWLVGAFLGLRSALTGVILATIVRSFRKNVSGVYGAIALALTATALIAFHLNAAGVLLAAAAVGLVFHLIRTATPRAGRTFRSIAVLPLVFMKYGLLCFGGGYVLMPMYIDDFIGPAAPYLQIAAEEFSNITSLTQITPGPIGVNAATFFGYRMGGVPGAVVATACILLPGFVLMTLALKSVERFSSSRVVQGILFGIRPAATALMVSALLSFAGMSIWNAEAPAFAINPLALTIAALTAAAVYTKRLGIMTTVITAAVVGALCR